MKLAPFEEEGVVGQQTEGGNPGSDQRMPTVSHLCGSYKCRNKAGTRSKWEMS